MTAFVQQVIGRLVEAKPEEVKALLWSFAYFFFLLASYFILRPLRDEMGAAAGRDFLQWLFTATFFVMLVVSPIYAAAVALSTQKDAGVEETTPNQETTPNEVGS